MTSFIRRSAWAPILVAWIVCALAATSCTKRAEETESTETSPLPSGGDTMPADTSAQAAESNDHILVQHVLIGFQGSVRGKTITRTQAEAEKLANEILTRARAGEDFGALVQQYTDDQYPGIYGLSNTGITPAENEFPRADMVKGFSDTAFSLGTGEVGMSAYDKTLSPFGWHVIKRVD